ncbi:hypothetical protein [Xenorhabdus beddingii]|uniref:hypothetical protein n=1 Tax=Xenorhabdus beddingii TaxID=40578 RepID=UPI0030D8AB29
MPKRPDKTLKSVTRRTHRSEDLDLTCRRNGDKFYLIRRWLTEEKHVCIWLTNIENFLQRAWSETRF